MPSTVQQFGKARRPEWNYTRGRKKPGEWPGMDSIANLEMLESVRNVLEDVRGSQMLQCDVAHAIKNMARATEELGKTLRRIDRRLAKLESLKLNGGQS